MDFREHQDMARRMSRRIWVAYLILLVLTAGLTALFISTLIFIGQVLSDSTQQQVGLLTALGKSIVLALSTEHGLLLTAVIGIAAMAIMGFSTLVGFFRNSNGHDVARHFGGRLISEGDPHLSIQEQRALNIVAELSLAANMTPPALYVIPESAINAFAAGRDREHAVVAVTQGALDNFDREQLAGVIAHELGHVANEDIKLNIRLAAFVLGFTTLFFLARMMFRQAAFRRGDARAKIVLVLVAAGIAVIGSLSVLSGRILQSMMSRQREYLADASAVQFTRHPQGIAGALRVIRDGGKSTLVSHPEAAEYSHAFLFKVNNSLFDTHPPIDERIRRLETRRDYGETPT